ncbi:MAG: hypothetical protein HZT40_20685 [Candidatus Thiothrix singaporensis]|uniref:Uncharacterized protein n=1 Tax=Candidatus Thiothrix singaporensis TaxID=2799669 RepID=A0A7L6AXC8_9GAMM|nr:MAG: hypothetical protein HZT40_20685 [Candidatus Thiothrix singaporensis]
MLKSWHYHRKGRKTAESKQSELEQQLKDLQGQYDSLHTRQQDSAAAKTQQPPTALRRSPHLQRQTGAV